MLTTGAGRKLFDSEEDAKVFYDELMYMLTSSPHQIALNGSILA
jgi:hypothetical protein